ncbi:MAG: tetratricopeptide repeat protein [Deltaproteobacteria bacterium]|nr:tetratricopeptide repeat protein [Deltaproteobacteria bacterium]
MGAGDYRALLTGLRAALAEANPELESAARRLVAAALEEAAEARPDREAAALLVRAAQLRSTEESPEDRQKAATALAGAWRRCPEPEVIESAWALLGSPEIDDAPDALVEARAQVGSAESRSAALSLLADRHLHAGRLGPARRALDLLRELAPEDPAILERIEAVEALSTPPTPAARQRGTRLVTDTVIADTDAATAVVERYQAEMAEASPDLRIILARRLFRILRVDLGRPDRAREVLQFSREAVSEWARDVLARADRRSAGREWEGAVALLDEAARQAEEPRDQVVLLLEAARLLEAELDAPDRAEKMYRRVRVSAPLSVEVLAFYRDWYAGRDEPRRAYATLAQLHGALIGEDLAPERIRVAGEMAELAAGELDSREKAIEAWRRILDDEPYHDEANSELRRLYTESGRWHALAEHLDAWVRALPDDAVQQKVDLLFELIALYQSPERLPMDDMVIATYQRIVALAPSNERALDDLASRYEDRQRWGDLIGVLRQKIELTEDPEELFALFTRIGDLYLERMRSDADAIPVLERLLELDPRNVEVLHRLREIHRRRSDSARTYETYQQELALLDGPARVDVLVELAKIATHELFLPEEARACWREVLKLEPGHDEALAALQELSVEQEDWPGYVRLLETQLESAATKKKKVEILQEMGEILHTRLGEEERALALFAQICELSPFNSHARDFLQRAWVTRRAWDRLTGLYAPRSDWKGYVALLRDFARKSDDAPLQADIHVEIARVESELLGDPATAQASLLDAIEAARHRDDIARKLLAEHDVRLDAPARLRAQEVIATHSDDVAERENAWREVADLREQAGDASGALEAWGQALLLEADRGDVEALGHFEAAAEAADGWEDASHFLGEATARVPDGATGSRVLLHRSLGAVLRGKLANADGAIVHFRRVLQLAPGDMAALDALEEIHLSRHDFEGLEEVLRARAEHAEDPERGRDARRRLGQLYEDVFLDLERAAATYQDILDQEPDDEEALVSLRRALSADEAWGELTSALEDLCPRLATAERRAALQFELARLYREQTAEPSMAALHLRDLLDHPEADRAAVIATLEAMFEAGEAPAAVAPVLEGVYRESGDHAQLARVLAVRADTSPTSDERLTVAAELARICEHELADARGAFEAQVRIFVIDPDDRAVWSELERLAGESDAYGELADLWRSAVGLEAPPDGPRPSGSGVRDQLRIELARLLRERLGADDEAIELYEAILDEPSAGVQYPEVLEALVVLYRAREDHEALVRVLLASSEGVLPGAERRQRIVDACELLAGPLGRIDDAVEHWERLATEDPTDDEVAERLEAAYETLERWEDLAAHLLRRAEAQTDPAKADRVRLARAFVRLERLNESEHAVRELLALVASPTCGADAREVLLDLAAADPTSEPIRQRIIAGLESHFETAEDDWGRAALEEVRATLGPPGEPRAKVLLQAARLVVPTVELATIGDRDPVVARRAFELAGRALTEAPDNERALELLDHLVGPLGLWATYATLCEDAASRIDDSAVRSELIKRVAVTAETRLDDDERAIKAWEALRVDHGPIEREALEALDQLYQRVGRAALRIGVLRRRAEIESVPAKRLAFFKEASILLDEAGQTDQAIAFLRRIVEETRAATDPALQTERAEAIERLEAMLGSQARFGELVELLVACAAQTKAQPEAASLAWLRRAASLAEEELREPDEAVRILELIRERAPDDPDALNALDRLHQAAGRWQDKADLIEIRLDIARREGDADRERILLFTLGQIRENRLGDLPGAIEAYAAALSELPTFPPAVAALTALARTDDGHAAARSALATAHRAAEAPAPLATVLQQTLEAGDPGIDSEALHLELARLMIGPLDAPAEAFAHAGRVLASTTTGPAAAEARELAVRAAVGSGRVDEAVLLLLDGARRATSVTARVQALDEAIALLQAHGVAPEAMVLLWQTIVSLKPSHGGALDALEELARAGDKAEDLVAVLRLREETTLDRAARRALRLEMARLLAGLPKHEREAVAAYETVLVEDPRDPEGFDELAALLRRMEAPRELAELLEHRIDVADADEDTRALRHELAELAHGPLHDPSRAVALYRELLDEAPDDEAAVEALEAMWGEGVERTSIFEALEPFYERTEAWTKLVALYRSTLEAEGDTRLQIECLAKVARVQEEHLGDPEGAYESSKALLLRVDEPDEHLDALEALAGRLDAYADLGALYDRMIAEGMASPTQIVHRARIALRHQEDSQTAIRDYKLALERQPDLDEARAELLELLETTESWAELTDLLEASAHHAFDAQEKRTDLLRAADVAALRLEAPDRAAALLEQALELSPTDADLAWRIVDLWSSTGHVEALRAHLRTWIDRNDPTTVAPFRLRLAESLLADPTTAPDGIAEVRAALSVEAAPEDAELLLATFLASAEHDSPAWKPAVDSAAVLLEASLDDRATDALRATIAEARFRVMDDTVDRRSALLELSRLHDRADDPDGAFERLAQAAREAPGDAEIEGQLDDLARRRDLWPRLADLYEARLSDDLSAELEERFLFKVANIHDAVLGDDEAAAPFYERLLVRQPDNLDALAMLARYYAECERPTDEARILTRWVEVEPAPEARSQHRRRLAVLTMDHVEDPETATRLLMEELPGAALDAELRGRLQRLLGEAHRFDDLARVLTLALEDPELDPEARVDLLARLAQTAEVHTGDLDAARDAAQAILAIEPEHAFALTSLHRVERRREDFAAVDEVLGKRIALAPTDALRARLLIERAEVNADHLQAPETALEYLTEAGKLEGEGSGSPALRHAFETLLRTPSTRVEAARALAPRYEAAEDWPGLASVLAMQQSGARSDEERETLARRAAGVMRERIGDPGAGLRVLLNAFEQLRGHGPLRADIEAAAEASDGFAQVAAASRRIMAAQPEVAVVRDLGPWLGAIERDRLQDPRAATETFERVLAADELNQEAMEALDALYRELSAWDALRLLLDRRLTVVSDEDRPRILEELAQLATRIEGPAAALRWWRDLLWARPEHAAARQSLEAMLGDPTTAREAVEVLEPVYRKESDWTALVRLFERQLAASAPGPETARLHVQAGDIYETRLDDAASAFKHFDAAFRQQPDDAELLRRLEHLASQLERWSELADAVEAVLPALDDRSRRTDLLLHAAQIREVKTGEPERAVASLRQVLADQPDHRAALMGLRRLHRARGDEQDLAEVTAALARITPGGEQRSALWSELLLLATRLGDDDLRVEAARAKAAGEDGDIEELAKVYEEAGRFDALADLLAERAEVVGSAPERAALRMRLGRLREERLGDLEGATDAYTDALDQDAEAVGAFDALKRIYRQREDWGGLFGLVARRAEGLGESAEAAGLWTELGALADTHLDNQPEAIRAYERALELDPDAADARDALIQIFQARHRPAELVELLVAKARRQSAPESLDLLAEAAELYVGPLDDAAKARPLLEEVLAAAPDHLGARRATAHLDDKEGRHAEAAAGYNALLPDLPEAARVDTLLALGRLYREKLDQPHEAAKALLAARDLAPDDAGLTVVLRELLQETGSWEELRDLLERDFEASASANERSERALALARLYQEHLDDAEGFSTWIARAEEARRDNPEVAEALIAWHTSRGEWAEVATRLEWLVNYLQGKKLLGELPRRAYELGGLFERLDAPDKALEYYKIALQADGTYLPNLVAFGRLLIAREAWDRALRVHQNLLMQRQKIEDPQTRSQVLYHLALACHELEQDAQARQYLKRLLAEAPTHPEGLALQARIAG